MLEIIAKYALVACTVIVVVVMMIGVVEIIFPSSSPLPSNEVSRYVDKESGVVCFLYRASSNVAMYCMPLGDTRLDGVGK